MFKFIGGKSIVLPKFSDLLRGDNTWRLKCGINLIQNQCLQSFVTFATYVYHKYVMYIMNNIIEK